MTDILLFFVYGVHSMDFRHMRGASSTRTVFLSGFNLDTGTYPCMQGAFLSRSHPMPFRSPSAHALFVFPPAIPSPSCMQEARALWRQYLQGISKLDTPSGQSFTSLSQSGSQPAHRGYDAGTAGFPVHLMAHQKQMAQLPAPNTVRQAVTPHTEQKADPHQLQECT